LSLERLAVTTYNTKNDLERLTADEYVRVYRLIDSPIQGVRGMFSFLPSY